MFYCNSNIHYFQLLYDYSDSTEMSLDKRALFGGNDGSLYTIGERDKLAIVNTKINAAGIKFEDHSIA